LAFTLVNDGPAEGYEEVHLNLASVEIRQPDGEWIALPMTPSQRRLEVMNHEGGRVKAVVEGAKVPVGEYEELRIRFAPGHSVKCQPGGAVRDLKGPNEFVATGLPIFVREGTRLEAVYTLRMARCIRELPPASGRFAFHPVQFYGAFRNDWATGVVLGQLTMAGTGTVVSGATVMAVTSVRDKDDANLGQDRQGIVQTATSDAKGYYHLARLPRCQDCRLVVRPGLGPKPHQFKASRILNLNKRFPEIFSLQLDPLKEEMGSIVVPPNPFGMANDSMEMGELTILKKCPAREGEPETMVVVDSRALSQDGPTEFEALCAGTYEIRYWKQSLTGFPGAVPPASSGILYENIQVLPGQRVLVTKRQ
jgi:hypothetical protein